MRLLVTDASHPVAVETITNLRRRHRVGLVVGTVDSTRRLPRSLPGFDRLVSTPPSSDAAFAQNIRRLARESGIGYVIPWSDSEAMAVSSARDDFLHDGVRLICADDDLLRVAQDKWLTHLLFTRYGMATPASRLVGSPDGLAGAAAELNYPETDLVVKPRTGSGGVGVWRISEHARYQQKEGMPALPLDALRLLCGSSPDIDWGKGIVLQERVLGDDVSVDFYAEKGELVAGGCRTRTATVSGLCTSGDAFPLSGDLREEVKSFVASARGDGIANIQMIVDPDGRHVFYEVNARLSGSVDVNSLGGLDLLGICLTGRRAVRRSFGVVDGVATLSGRVSFVRHWATHSWE